MSSTNRNMVFSLQAGAIMLPSHQKMSGPEHLSYRGTISSKNSLGLSRHSKMPTFNWGENVLFRSLCGGKTVTTYSRFQTRIVSWVAVLSVLLLKQPLGK